MHRYLVFCTAVLSLIANTSAFSQEIWIVTDRMTPLHSVPRVARVVNQDEAQRQEETLSADLPEDSLQAASIFRTRLQNHPEISRQLADAYQGVVDALALGIQKIPAVVVDRRYVVYGEQDVNKAVSRIQAFRESQ